MPGDAPKPVAFIQNSLRRGPSVTVFGESGARLATDIFFAFVNRTAKDQHQTMVRHDGKFRVAQIDTIFCEHGGRIPAVAIFGREDADLAVAADVRGGFAE